MDCEKLSPNARKVFDKIKEHYSLTLDPWGNLQWKKEGLVYDNGWQDLRKAEVRDGLIRRYELQIGSVIVIFAKDAKGKGKEITESVFHFKLSKKWIELAVLFHELDFQIETLDLIE